MICTGLVLADDSHRGSDFHPEKVYERIFYIDSNLEFTLLHELAHAVIDINHVPVLGGQENAADQIAILLMITTHHGVGGDLLDKLIAISGEWMMEWQEQVASGDVTYWDAHPLQIQRFYELTCLVYGAEPDVIETIRTESWLPIQRAWYCNQEYVKNREALAWLAKEYSHVEFDADWNLVTQESQGPNIGAVKLQIGQPITNENYEVYSMLVKSRRLQYLIARSNQILKLDRDIDIVFEAGCSGPDAWWNNEQNTVFICYQLIEQFSSHSKEIASSIRKLSVDPEYTMLISLPKDVRLWMLKESLTPAQLNLRIIDILREQEKVLGE